MRGAGTDGPVGAMKPGNAGGAKGPDTLAPGRGQPAMEGAAVRGKAYDIPKRLVWERSGRMGTTEIQAVPAPGACVSALPVRALAARCSSRGRGVRAG